MSRIVMKGTTMRIIASGNMKDFYDAMAYVHGVDPVIVYDRRDKKTHSVNLKRDNGKPMRFARSQRCSVYKHGQRFEVECRAFVVFAGGIPYQGYTSIVTEWGGVVLDSAIHFSTQDVSKFVNQYAHDCLLKDEIAYLELDEEHMRLLATWANENHVINAVPSEEGNPFVWQSNDTFYEGNNFLKNYKLYELVDAHTVWVDMQEKIMHYQTPKMVGLQNDERIVKAGFDKKISFRGGNK